MAQAKNNNNLIRKSLLVLYIAGILGIGIYLFFGDKIGNFFKYGLGWGGLNGSSSAVGTSLKIGYAYKPASLDPIQFDPVSRNYLIDIYEGLVLTDSNLKIVPGLAISWGLLDSNTWEFRLRPGIKFHNGEPVTAEDVISSITRARDNKNSQLKNFLNTIKDIRAQDKEKIRIITTQPDPLLLTKLAVVYIYPSGLGDFSKPVGTGPYKFSSMDNEQMILINFSDYWDKARGYYELILLKYIADRESRLKALEDEDVMILTNVPPLAAVEKKSKYAETEGVSPIKSENIDIRAIPSLEVSFIMLNLDNPVFKSVEARKAISVLFDQQVFVDLSLGFARPANQFVSSGVFGFNPAIDEKGYKMEEAKEALGQVLGDSFEKTEVTFDYPENLEAVGQYVAQQFKEAGIDVVLNPLTDADLQQKIMEGDSDFYYLGWKSELGDAGDFLDSVVHSKDLKNNYGQFNGSHYVNKKVDELIESIRVNLDNKTRLADMQEVMRIITDEDVMGVPLFESDTIFAYLKNIQFEPRIDGYMHADEVR